MLPPVSPLSTRSSSGLALAVLYALSGVLFGVALSTPALGLLAWPSIAVLAAALHRPQSGRAATLGILMAQFIGRVVGCPWVWTAGRQIFGSVALTVAPYIGLWTSWSLPTTLTIGLFYRLFRTRVAVRFWLPAAWALGELVSYALNPVCIDNWLNTQWQVTPMLRALAAVGWWPLLIGSLFAAASIGEAIAVQSARRALPALVVVGAIAHAPLIPAHGEEKLAGIAALHTNSTVDLPHLLPKGVDLLVWPEAALDLRPLLAEGPGKGAVIPSPLPGAIVNHLLGLVTSLPGGSHKNSVLAVASDGHVLASRAKRLFMPIAERRVLFFGHTRFLAGERPVRLDVSGRAIAALVCGETFSRSLVAEGKRSGAELMAIVAREGFMPTDTAHDQLLAIQVMRSVEFGLPSVRAAYGGHASFVAADGRVLGRSVRERNGVLIWDPERGGRDVDFRGRFIDVGPPPIDPVPDVAVLYSEQAPELRARCPEGRCAYYPIEHFVCQRARVATVIVSGHGQPPDYLARPEAEIAAAVRCFNPQLVVIDTCFGSTSDLLKALGDLEAVVVAAASLLPPSGFVYDPGFFASSDPLVRAAAVNTLPVTPLLRWRIDPSALTALLAGVDAMDAEALGARLARRRPSMAKVELPRGGPVLVPVAWERLRSARLLPRMSPPVRPDR